MLYIYGAKRSTFIWEGILFVILGIICLALPAATSLSVTLIVGILCIIAGVVQLIRALPLKKGYTFWLSLLNALLLIIVGLLLLTSPLAGMMALTAILGIWFLVSGIFQIIVSFEAKTRHRNWGVLFFSGIISVVLGFLIFYGWPVTSLWLIGTFIGINLLLFGLSLLALAYHVID